MGIFRMEHLSQAYRDLLAAPVSQPLSSPPRRRRHLGIQSTQKSRAHWLLDWSREDWLLGRGVSSDLGNPGRKGKGKRKRNIKGNWSVVTQGSGQFSRIQCVVHVVLRASYQIDARQLAICEIAQKSYALSPPKNSPGLCEFNSQSQGDLNPAILIMALLPSKHLGMNEVAPRTVHRSRHQSFPSIPFPVLFRVSR